MILGRQLCLLCWREYEAAGHTMAVNLKAEERPETPAPSDLLPPARPHFLRVHRLPEHHYQMGINIWKHEPTRDISDLTRRQSPSGQVGLLAHGQCKHVCQVKYMTMTPLWLSFTKGAHSLPSFLSGKACSPSSIVCSFFSLGWAASLWPPQILQSSWSETRSFVASFPAGEDWCLFTIYEKKM